MFLILAMRTCTLAMVCKRTIILNAIAMQNIDILALAGLRIDGRRPADLRSMKHKLSVVKSADGSAYLEQGLNKVLVMVHGPQEPKRRVLDQTAEKV
jgi:ribonuclease PH